MDVHFETTYHSDVVGNSSKDIDHIVVPGEEAGLVLQSLNAAFGSLKPTIGDRLGEYANPYLHHLQRSQSNVARKLFRRSVVDDLRRPFMVTEGVAPMRHDIEGGRATLFFEYVTYGIGVLANQGVDLGLPVQYHFSDSHPVAE